MRQFIKYFLVFFAYYFPSLRKDKIFVSILSKKNNTGPGRFIANIEKGLKKQNLLLERNFLGKCRWALIISSAPFSFYRFCEKRGIKTILRVDGFSLPILYDNQDYDYRHKREMTLERIKTNQALQNGLYLSSFVVFQSHFSKKIASQYLFNRTKNYQIIYNGVDTEVFCPKKSNLNDIPILSVHGTLRDPDIINCALHAFRIISKSIVVKICFIGALKNGVKEIIDNFKINNDNLDAMISYTNEVTMEALSQYLAEVDISLHLTSGDACPNAVLESLATGLPVICQSWGGAAELVGPAGVIIDIEPYYYGEKFSILVADAVTKIVNNYTYLTKIARQRAVNEFSLDRMSSQYTEIFRQTA